MPGPADQQLAELHVCMGLNSCAATETTRHDPDGTAPMAGMGSCATIFHACHGDNACRGRGGCGYAGTEVEQMKPGDQSCNANGSCASPINISRISFRNVMGLWLLSESIRTWTLQGLDIELAEVLGRAAELPADGPRMDPDAPDAPGFLPPGDMPSRIVSACAAAGQPVPTTPPEIVRCILDSLAATFAARVECTASMTEVVRPSR